MRGPATPGFARRDAVKRRGRIERAYVAFYSLDPASLFHRAAGGRSRGRLGPANAIRVIRAIRG